jgi:hypothetical protein
MFYELLNPGDRILTVIQNFLAIERTNDSVDLYPIFIKDNQICLNTDSVSTIGFSENEHDDNDDYVTESGVSIVKF